MGSEYLCKRRYSMKPIIKNEHKDLNVDYFKEIDTLEKAYWLGFLYADGGMKGNVSIIELNIKDESHIDKFISCINADPLKKKYRHNKQFNSDSCKISICNKTFTDYLKDKGCIINKTKRLTLPIFQKEDLYKTFLLGYYDGDGCCGSTVICSASFEFLKQIKEKFNIKHQIRLTKNPLGECHVLAIGVELLESCLSLYGESLERKKNFRGGVCIDCGKYIYLTSKRCKSCDDIFRNIKRGFVQHFCKICGCEITQRSKSGMCLSCVAKTNRKTGRPSKEELQRLLTESSYSAVARCYGVSGTAVKKWAKFYGIYEKLLFPRVEIQCLTCGKSFLPPNKNSKYCSPECSSAAQKRLSISVEEITKEVRKNSYQFVAQKYNISISTVQKYMGLR